MALDTFLTVVLYLMQGILAILGIYVSIKPQPVERHKLLIGIFIAVLTMGILAGIGVQVLNKRDNETQQRQYKNELKTIGDQLLLSQLSQQRMKGQLDAIGLIIGNISQSVSNTGMKQMALAVEKLAQSSQVTTSTNKQICSNTMELVRRINKFSHDRKNKYDQLLLKQMADRRAVSSKSLAEGSKVFWQEAAQLQQLSDNDLYEFRTTILAEAIYLKNELLTRLPSEPNPAGYPYHVFEGSLAGGYPEKDVAIYLEGLVRKLCPN